MLYISPRTRRSNRYPGTFTVKEVSTPTVVASQPLKKPFCQVWPSAKEILGAEKRSGSQRLHNG